MACFTTILLLSSSISIANGYYLTTWGEGSKEGALVSVEISGCDQQTAEWCPLKKGTNVDLKLSFTSATNATKVQAVVHGVLGPVPIPFELPNSDGCVDSGLECPLQDGQSYMYIATLPILKAYPKVHVTVQWELRDENNVDIVCFKIPTRIV